LIKISNIRYYKGKIKCQIIHKGKKKALVKWLESCNIVGNKELGYKKVKTNDKDIICSMRLLNKNKRDDKKYIIQKSIVKYIQ